MGHTMSEEKQPWISRKQQVREKYYRTLADPTTEDDPLTRPATPGNAPWKAVTEAASSVMAGARRLLTSDTSATDTDLSGMPLESPESTTPVESTKSDSEPSTAWMVSPLGFVEQILKPTIVDPNGSLTPGLPLAVQQSLQALAIGRGEPVEETVQQIAEFFIENEDERCEGTLRDAVIFYMTNFAGVRV